MRITQDRIDNCREFLRQYETLDNRGQTTRVGWIMLKFSCSHLAAARLIHAAETNLTTDAVVRLRRQRRRA